MANQLTMEAKDIINGASGECYVTIEGIRYYLMSLKKMKADAKKTKEQFGILGNMKKGNKSTGLELTASATIYDNTPIFRRLLTEYKDTGKDIYFTIQATNDDPSSDAGRQTIIMTGCNIDGACLFQLDVDSAGLETDIDLTFEDWYYPEEFTELAGTF